jgi:hypothetical protein
MVVISFRLTRQSEWTLLGCIEVPLGRIGYEFMVKGLYDFV